MSDNKTPDADAARTSTTKDQPDSSDTTIELRHTTAVPKIEGSHTQETIDPAERLPDDPDEQNDLA